MIKQEKKEPWAIRLVVKNEAVVDVKREHKDEDSEPWPNTLPTRNDGDDDSTIKRPTKQQRINPDAKEMPEDQAPGSIQTPVTTSVTSKPQGVEKRKEPKHWIGAQNYAAVEADSKEFGLIPMGVESGVRTLIMHVPRGKQGWQVFQHVQPGGAIKVVKVRSGGTDPRVLRVRFTTPSQYYPPGAKVSCITIGVDDAEWQSLMTKPCRI